MHRQVNAIVGRLSLRPPQRRSLEILDRVTELIPLRKDTDAVGSLAAIRAEFPAVTDFERDFPSLCFALATGVGKTRLMGASIAYLHLAHGVQNFFVLAPNLTIYDKLIADFTPNTPKYVFKGIAEFAVNTPTLITGDNYQKRDPLSGTLFGSVRINVFNISKINSEVRGQRKPLIRKLSEYIGQSYFDYLAGLPDLVLLMDESHRYRASAGVRAINELRPVLGLELTATPYLEAGGRRTRFANVVYDYPLAQAMADGFVKEPAVVTQKNFDASQFTPAQLEEIKLQDGVRLHENVKVELETYARQTGERIVKPFMLVIARDIAHATALVATIKSEQFFAGRYADKVIQVDSSRSGAEDDAVVERLLQVESADEPTEIVVHVNMLKEGWDVTNLYTIVPLRAANARVLIEQSIGRGLRLPYGRRTGVAAVDRLSIVAHDRFQEIVDDANRADSSIRLTAIELDPRLDFQPARTVVVQSNLDAQILAQAPVGEGQTAVPPIFATDVEREVASLARHAMRRYEALPSARHLLEPDVLEKITGTVAELAAPTQAALPGMAPAVDFAAVVARTAQLLVDETIDIPRIVLVPRVQATTFFTPFRLDTSGLHFQPVAEALLIQELHSRRQETLSVGSAEAQEARLENYLVRGLVDFDDVSYDDHADLLYDLAGQIVAHLRSYLATDADVRNVVLYYQRPLAEFIHAQMWAHRQEAPVEYDVEVRKGFTEVRCGATTLRGDDSVRDFHETVTDRQRIGQMLFGGFQHCLCRQQKFASDSERKLALVLDRHANKWFRPTRGQFQIFYRLGIETSEYVPDFVAESDEVRYLIEVKARGELESPEVRAKTDAALRWCSHANEHARVNDGRPWRYLLIPHDAIAENLDLAGLERASVAPAPS
ncbi:MAG: DEAD/DEAH box helicase family protein [bacterium]